MNELQQTWLDIANLNNIPNHKLYSVRKLPNIEYYWLDGCCGYQVASGDSLEAMVESAISKIKLTFDEINNGKLVAFTSIFT